MSDELFPASEVAMDSPRLVWQKRVCAELEIFTHWHADSLWMAFSMAQAKEALSDYSLTDEEKSHPVALFSGYCRLLDEAGMVADNEPTEFAAIVFVATRHGVKLHNEEPEPPVSRA